jgi:uncharacterized protein (DUF4415 family)
MKSKTSKLVEYRLDLNNLPPPTDAQFEELKALAARPDSEIDFSDIPELTDEQWQNAIRRRYYKPIKQQITARLDSDVLH